MPSGLQSISESGDEIMISSRIIYAGMSKRRQTITYIVYVSEIIVTYFFVMLYEKCN